MKITPSTLVQKNRDVIFKIADGTTYILDTENSTVHTLNETAAFIWKAVQKTISIKEIASKICQKFEVDYTNALKDTLNFVKKYSESGYIITKNK